MVRLLFLFVKLNKGLHIQFVIAPTPREDKMEGIKVEETNPQQAAKSEKQNQKKPAEGRAMRTGGKKKVPD